MTSVPAETALAPPGSASYSAWEVLNFPHLSVTADEIAADNYYTPIRDVVVRWNELALSPITLWELRLYLQNRGDTAASAVQLILRELNDSDFGLRLNRRGRR